MKISFISFIVVFLFAATSFGQSSTGSLVKSQAMEMAKAMVNGDTKNFSRYMLPELIEAGGGADKVNFMMDSMFVVFKSFGGKVDKITYGNPGKIVKFKKELQTTLPQTTKVTSSFGDVELSSTLVAISRDSGKNWYFYDTSMGRADQLKDKLPNLSPEIVVPTAEKPKFTPKN